MTAGERQPLTELEMGRIQRFIEAEDGRPLGLAVAALLARAVTAESALARLQDLIGRAAAGTQQPIDLNYVALLKDDWEDITGVALAGSSPAADYDGSQDDRVPEREPAAHTGPGGRADRDGRDVLGSDAVPVADADGTERVDAGVAAAVRDVPDARVGSSPAAEAETCDHEWATVPSGEACGKCYAIRAASGVSDTREGAPELKRDVDAATNVDQEGDDRSAVVVEKAKPYEPRPGWPS